MCSVNYQDNITMPLLCEHDYDATAGESCGNEIDEIATNLDNNAHAASGVLPMIERVDITQLLYKLN